jgi:hypothetical protein
MEVDSCAWATTEASEFPGDVVPDLDPIPEEVVGKGEVLRALQYCRQEGLTTLTDIIKLTTRGRKFDRRYRASGPASHQSPRKISSGGM